MRDEAMKNPEISEDLARAVEAFLERQQRGEQPSVHEIVERFPERAEEAKRLLSVLNILEDLKSVPEETPSYVQAEGGAAVTTLKSLGDYRILREVGRGGMGVVYEAVQESLDRHVALKVLPAPACSDPRRLERFYREARAAARLHHAHIVPVFGIGEAAGVHYYAMQLIRGHSLDHVIEKLKRLRRPGGGGGVMADQEPESICASATSLMTSALEVKDAASSSVLLQEVARQRLSGLHSQYFRNVALLALHVAEALAYAHGEGVLHRDIMPSNLLLEESGTVWLTDFGLAKDEGNESLTQTSDLMGTPAYMAPECFRGWADSRSDIYGLGVTLYELATLKPAFHDTDRVRLIRKVLQEDPPPPRKLDPRIPSALETIVLKATAKNMEERYSTAQELADDLRRFLEHKSILARRPSITERTAKWARRRRAAVASAAVAGIVASVGLTLSTAHI